MTSVNFLKPNKDNLNLFLVAGALFFTLGLVDFCLNNFYDKNITGFLPGFISFFTPTYFWNDRSSFNKNRIFWNKNS
jgi:general L-amino acid transport system permease protein